MSYLLKELAFDEMHSCMESLSQLVERHLAWSDRCYELLLCGTTPAGAAAFAAERWFEPEALCDQLRCLAQVHALLQAEQQLMPKAQALVATVAAGQALETGNYSAFIAALTEVRRALLDLEAHLKQNLSAASRLTAGLFENAAEAVIITDPRGVILDVNATFCHLTEYERDEVVGHRPAVLKSGRHDEEFYRTMWAQLLQEGRWQGEVWNRRKGGELFPEWLSISAMRADDGQVLYYVGMFSDITLTKRNEERLERLAHYDPLTELPNRGLFRQHLEQALSWATRNASQLAVLFVDLDRFKLINDTLGHAAGDQLLIEVARRLRACVRHSDTVSRLGGDEFTLLLRDVKGEQGVIAVVEKVREVMAVPFTLCGQELFVSPSIGIGLFPSHGADADALLKAADLAMYRAKEAGRNTYQFYRTGGRDQVSRQFHLENDLRRALERNELVVEYQPQVDVDSTRIIGVEALIRWRHPERGLLGPDDFIPLAEESGLIDSIGEWVLQQACHQGQIWRQAGLPPLHIAVNLSARQLRQPDFADRVEAVLAMSGFESSRLTLELTETAVMQNPHLAAETLGRLRQLGVAIAIDDFGRGYTSLAYLKRLPVDAVKIDRSFVSGLAYDDDDQAISRAIIALAESLHLKVVAEGVEEQEQLAFLRKNQCRDAQGFLFSRPLTPEGIAALLSKRHGSD